MIHVSNEFRNLMAEDHRNFLAYAEITLADGTELGTIDNSKIWQGGFRIDDGVTSSGQFTIGSCIINKLTLVLNNIYDDFSEYDFYHAKIVASVGLELSDGKIEKIQKGIYTVDNPQYDGALITLECLDNMYKLDTDYSKVSTKYPATIGEIVREMCDKCDVPLLSATFEGADIVIQERPEDEALTCRQMLLYCCQRICKFARCDTHGRLVIGWFEQEIFERNVKLDGGVFDDGTPLYTTGDKADGGSFNPWNEGAKVDGGTFEDWEAYHNLYSEFSLTVSTDDVVITGIQVTATSRETDEDNKPETFVYGEAGYVLDISQNLLITPGKAQEVAEYIGKKLVGLRFRPMNGTFLADPTIEAGDIAYVTDYKQNTYNCLLTNLTFTVGDSMQISCDAETPRKNSTSRYSELTKSVVQSRKWYEHEKTERELAMETLSEELAHSSGLYMTAQVQDDGSTIYYMHDKSTLGESKIVWKLTADAFGISTDGGKTYPYGLDATGMAILSRIYTIGLDADYINSGALAVRKNGKETFYANVDTGEVRIVADQFSLSSGVTFESTLEDANAYADGAANSAQQAAEKKAADALSKFITETYDPKLADVQKQLDGQFESYYYDYQPTDDNVPASEWTSDELKKAHEGDLFYWKTKGFSYRWTKDGDTYKWVQVQDSGINDALGAASKAQDTADGKRRTFLETPTPPYDKGDLWYGGTSSEVKVCTTSKAADGAYAAGDWEKYDKYIDQAAANSAANSAVNAQTQEFVFNKLTDNGNIKGLFMQDGQMYMNATYINTGTFKVSKEDKETFYANVDTGEVRIVADQFSLSSGVTFESTLEDAKEYADRLSNDNLLKSPFDLDNTDHWAVSGKLLSRGLDPTQGVNAFGLQPTNSSDNFLSAHDKNNKPLKYAGMTYTFSVWLRTASTPATIVISLNRVSHTITVGTTWKQYSFTLKVDTIESGNQVTIGGFGSFLPSDGTIYIYNPCVKYEYSNEELFNHLTNNGTIQGLFMQDGKLYMNAEYITTGKLADKAGKNFWDLTTGEFSLSSTAVNDAGNLLLDYYGFSTTYWSRKGSLTTGLEDPDGGSNAVKLRATDTTDNFISTHKSKNRPIMREGMTYSFSVWLKADNDSTKIKISLNRVVHEIVLGQEWKQFTITEYANTISQEEQVTIGGFGSFLPSQGSIYIYDPCVRYEYSSEELFNHLTDNGTVKGIFMQNGSLYVNASYIKTGVITSTNGNSSWSLDTGVFRNTIFNAHGTEWIEIAQSVISGGLNDYEDGLLDLSAQTESDYGTVRDTVLRSFSHDVRIIALNNISFASGDADEPSIFLSLSNIGITCSTTASFTNATFVNASFSGAPYFNGGAYFNGNVAFNYSAAFYGSTSFTQGFYVPTGTNARIDGVFYVCNLPHVLEGGHLVLGADGMTVSYLGGSSARYKNIREEVTIDDVKGLYDAKVMWAKYKDDFLSKSDERYGVYLPMLIAENIEEVLPLAVDHKDGLPEDWNERIIIPVMLKLIQDLNERISVLESKH